MRLFKYFILLSFFFFQFQSVSFAQKRTYQDDDYKNFEVEMADKLRADGKIYVVVAVITTILLGLIVYTITIDRKISGLEKEFHQKSQK